MTSIQICELSSHESFAWPDGCEVYRAMFAEMSKQATPHWVANCETNFWLCRLGDHLLPITENDAQYSSAYVCSPYSGAIDYPLFELRELPVGWLRFALAVLIKSVCPLLRFGRINRCVSVNNWLLSTNLFPVWPGDSAELLIENLVARFPTHAIVLRSLNDATNPGLCNKLHRAGFSLVPSRQTYVFADANLTAGGQHFLNCSNTRTDLKLLATSSEYVEVGHDDFCDVDDARIKELYDQLYLTKYTPLNPQFTVDLIRVWRKTGFIKLFGLRRLDGRLDGVVGCVEREGVNSAPLVGYDTDLPKRHGLYRMLMAIVIRESAERGAVLNLSSGAAHFKRLRGGRPAVEYSGVYTRHLPARQRAIWALLSLLMNRVGKPLLQKYEL